MLGGLDGGVAIGIGEGVDDGGEADEDGEENAGDEGVIKEEGAGVVLDVRRDVCCRIAPSGAQPESPAPLSFSFRPPAASGGGVSWLDSLPDPKLQRRFKIVYL